ncbi:MAG TPA: carboxypeptidase-like regulatory domain-containing protein [Kofleriaceae bacterium]|nr:carboxypeptidase-like regulatory domain-containing protein [Kofleriaceae bacterium]
MKPLALHRLFAAAAILAALAACRTQGTTPRTAPFRSRPDMVTAGDLRGPFTGRVLDAANRAPVAGAMVYATWTFQQPGPFAIAAGYREAVASTDATGRYRIAELAALPANARVVDFQLVIYKRGFVAYRSDRRFNDFGPRRDFAQLENQVELERWRPEYSHARHVRFVGGGAAVAAVTAWEGEAAVAELDPSKAGPGLPSTTGEGPYLVAAQLLTPDDIKARTRYDGSFETGPLGDEPDTATYSSQHFKALGRSENWDVALRLWRLDPAGALDRYDELKSGLPGTEERDEIASKSLRAVENDIYGVAFLDGQRGLVVLLTCGKSQCQSADDAAALGQAIHRRIKELWPLDRNQAGGTP